MFSVILPVYNGAAFVSKAIDCVLAQTYTDFELIIVNDGSRDNTLEVLSAYEQDPRVRIISQPNGGVSAARNTGMEAAKGDYFAFIDADDQWNSNHLEVISDMIGQYPSAGLYATQQSALLPNGETVSGCHFSDEHPGVSFIEDFLSEYAKDKSAKCYNNTSNVISAEAVRKCGGYKVGCKIGEDLALSLKVAVYYPFVLSSEPTTLYDRSQSSATAEVSFDPDWYFFDEALDILKDETVPETRRESFAKVIDWFRMRRVRHYLIDGRRQDARRAVKEICDPSALGKDMLITKLLFCMPTSLVRKLFLARWKRNS